MRARLTRPMRPPHPVRHPRAVHPAHRPVRHIRLKRLLDVVAGTALLLITAPLLAAAAAWSAVPPRRPGGPYTQETRTGLHGQAIVIRSLRSRRLRLDLLSRLPHVVRGELSLVGPAALAPDDPRAAAPWRQSVKPGLTGLAQLARHSAMPWYEAALLDQHYVEHLGVRLDLAILLRTPGAMRGRDRVHPGRRRRKRHGPRPRPTTTYSG
ncbi:sugar transferase [Streptomyces sp. NPDC127084]|uniref:sugar transferase n=1 Tax=Streptomyces sp. NPDC127084 TaxID=3347133 RepID=UPI003665ADBB